MNSQNDKMEKAKEVISKILDEEKEHKLKELDLINERLQQTEENLDKLRFVDQQPFIPAICLFLT